MAAISVYFGLLALALVYIALRAQAAAPPRRPFDWVLVFRTFTHVVLYAQIFIAIYGVLGFALDAIPSERLGNTHEFLITLPISPVDKVIGLFGGVSLLPMLLWVLTVPIALLAGALGNVPFSGLLWLHALMLTGWLAFTLIGIALGVGIGRARMAFFIVLGAFAIGFVVAKPVESRGFSAVPLMAIGPFSTVSPCLSPPELLSVRPYDYAGFRGRPSIFAPGQYHFFGASVPWPLAPICFYVFFAVVGFAAAARKLARPVPQPLPRWATLLGWAVFHVMLIGFLADTLSRMFLVLSAVLYMGAFFALLLGWALFAATPYGPLMEWLSRRRLWPVKLLTDPFSDTRVPPLLPLALLWVITMAAVMAIPQLYTGTASSGSSDFAQWQATAFRTRVPLLGLILGLFLLAYFEAHQFACTFARRGGRWLGLLLMGLLVLLPMAFSNITGYEAVGNATPFGTLRKEIKLATRHVIAYEMPGYRPDYDAARHGASPALTQALCYSLVLVIGFGGLCMARMHSLRKLSPAGRAERSEGAATAPSG